MSPREMPPTARGYNPYDVVSALQKSIRRSDPEAALYWGAELFKSGYNAWAWKRLRVIMTEDVGPAMPPGTVADILALKTMAEESTRKEKPKDASGEFFHWAHAVILLCRSPKTRIADNAFMKHLSDSVERREIPDEAHDVHTLEGRKMGRGWQHFVEESGKLIDPDVAAQSRGYESMDAELEAISNADLQHFLKRQSKEGRASLPSNPFKKREPKAPANPPGVKTLHVDRPLGIPIEKESE